ncbi:hypothetical protein [Rheinheimera sediminis]|uniref:hypothetical protein n=1 Tax=Rheinheimera sp. YQF-1 TaxID=2499626 RepID=UPI0016490EA5|nr:hypothetical protein [Rheinheimera sp. YQF-1]
MAGNGRLSWFGGLVVWWFGGLVVWWFGGLSLTLQELERAKEKLLKRIVRGRRIASGVLPLALRAELRSSTKRQDVVLHSFAAEGEYQGWYE